MLVETPPLRGRWRQTDSTPPLTGFEAQSIGRKWRAADRAEGAPRGGPAPSSVGGDGQPVIETLVSRICYGVVDTELTRSVTPRPRRPQACPQAAPIPR